MNIAFLVRAFGFWACFWLALTVLRQMPFPAPGGAAAAGTIIIVVVLLLVLGLLKIDGGSRHDVGLGFSSKSLPQFALGVGLGVALAASMGTVLLILTPLEIDAIVDSDILMVLGVSFLILFVLALMEELAFRSYALFRLEQALDVRSAIYISSIAFAFYHGFSFDNLLGPGVWGLFYGWMAITTKSIALPTGFHLGLNWLQALVGMKPQYGASIWELSIGAGSGIVDVEVLGMLIQISLLVVGILMVENLVRKQRASNQQQ